MAQWLSDLPTQWFSSSLDHAVRGRTAGRSRELKTLVDYALEMVSISKRFPGTLAVDNVDFSVAPGEVHALLGENGAGKSTLMKVLAGAFSDYAGDVRINGRAVGLHSPATAKAHGIAMIQQELNLSGPQSIAENLLAGQLPTRAGVFIDRRAMMRMAKERIARVGLELDPSTPVEQLSQHEAQLVEIAKALGSDPKILVMDEPTSALTRDDVEILFAIIRRLKEEGLAIVYISHHLSEVFQVADKATVMRDGQVVGVREVCGSSPEELVQLMVGRELPGGRESRKNATGPERVRVECLTRRGFFVGASFAIRSGEVVGLCGLAGAGRTELGRSLCGIDPVHEGTMFIDGKQVRFRNLTEALREGVAYMTEDRKLQGLALRLDVAENIASALIHKSIGFLFSRSKNRGLLRSMIEALQVNPPDPRQVAGNLSGGNQQKVLLAKWLAVDPGFIVLDEPTRGVDIGAKSTILEAILKLADQGRAVLVISSDMPELISLCDRILIMRKGRLIGEVAGRDATEENLLLAASGAMEALR
jgi:ribose transport system ATP-binding protein